MNGRHRVLATIALLAAALLATAGCDVVFQGMNAQATDQWTRTYKLEPGGQVEIISPNGSIDVTASADTATVEVVAERRARAATEEAAREDLKAIHIREQVTPAAIKLEVPRSSGGVHFGRGSREVNFRLKVPKTAKVRVDTRNGAVHVAGISGALKADSTNGDITGENLGGAVEAATTNGSVKVHVTSVQPDGIRLDTTNGEIELRMPAEARATIAARWVNGGFETSGLNPQGEKERRRYEGKLNGGGPRVELNTTNGRIRISS